MKNLPNEKFNIVDCSLNANLLAEIDFNLISNIKSPSCLIFRNGFSSGITVGYHTNVVKLITTLVNCGSKVFLNYLKGFSEHYNVDISLIEIIECSEVTNLLSGDIIDYSDIDCLISILSSNRLELLDFISILKKFRPKELSCKLNSFKDLERNEFNYYISFIEVSTPSIVESILYPISKENLVGSFNREFPYDLPDNYDNLVDDLSDRLESFGLGFAVESMVDYFREVNNDLFSPKCFNLSIYSLPMIYSFIYDVVFTKMKRLVRVNVNEG